VALEQSNDPAIISAAVNQLEEPAKVEIQTVAPSNTEVSLPGGFITRDGSLVKYAEVRELNGIDEEAIAKAGTSGRALMIMAQRGLVSLGMEPAGKEDIDNLLAGDRDAILIGIRRITFGDTLEYSFPCPHCKTDLDIVVDLGTDVPSVDLEDPINDRVFTYTSKKHGEIVVQLPTGSVQKKLLENSDKTSAELNTILLAGCVVKIGSVPSMGASSVLKLGMADREEIVAEIIKRNPGPRLGEVKTTCEACGEEILMPLSLADLFRL
jgi:hypothetical protein